MIRHLHLVVLLSTALDSIVHAQVAEEPVKNQQQQSEESEDYDPFRYVLSTRQSIENYERLIKEKPGDANLLVQLASLYIRDARETGHGERYQQADQILEKVAKLDEDHLGALQVRLALLSANHRFRETLELAEDLYKKYPKAHGLLSVIGDAQLELGNVDLAEESYRKLKEHSPLVHLESRLSRVAFIRGKPDEAIALMQSALEEEMFTSVTKEGRAWYLMQMGELYFEVGKLPLAEQHLNEAYEMHPKYPPTLALLARINAARGRFEQAIKLYEAGIALNSDLGMLADLGDLHLQRGELELARKTHDRFVQIARQDPAHGHDLAEFYCNHDRHLDEALKLTEQDLKLRQNEHAYDAYAWALYKNERYADAGRAIEQALRWGTKEAELLYHAALIERKLGHRDRSRSLLKEALAMNPHFSILQAPKARQILEELEADSN